MSSGETIDDLAGVRGTSTDDPSGALRAREAHEAGAVIPPLEVPTFDVHLEFRVRGPEADVQELIEGLTDNLVQHPLISSPVAASRTER